MNDWMKKNKFVVMLELKSVDGLSGGVCWVREDGKLIGDSNDENGWVEVDLVGWIVVRACIV